jgi:sugar phosphate isomerase/epimerase
VLLEELTALGHHAASVGATVLLEPLNRYEDHMVNTLETAVSLVREVGLSSVAVTADFYHMNIEETDVAASLRAAAPHLRHVHLSDSNRREPGAGHLDWNRMIDVLDGIGYDGWLAVECQLSGAPAHVLLAVSALVRGNSPIAGRWDR